MTTKKRLCVIIIIYFILANARFLYVGSNWYWYAIFGIVFLAGIIGIVSFVSN